VTRFNLTLDQLDKMSPAEVRFYIDLLGIEERTLKRSRVRGHPEAGLMGTQGLSLPYFKGRAMRLIFEE
jgi:hypothetical protein